MKIREFFPSKQRLPPTSADPEKKRRRLEKAAEEARLELEKSQDPERLHALLTGEGLEVLACEVCASPLRFKVCMNPGCHHVNPRAPKFIGVPPQGE
jgi:hypothetical protein